MNTFLNQIIDKESNNDNESYDDEERYDEESVDEKCSENKESNDDDEENYDDEESYNEDNVDESCNNNKERNDEENTNKVDNNESQDAQELMNATNNLITSCITRSCSYTYTHDKDMEAGILTKIPNLKEGRTARGNNNVNHTLTTTDDISHGEIGIHPTTNDAQDKYDDHADRNIRNESN